MKETPNYFAVIPADVRYDENLKDKAKLLYGEIVALSDKNGYCYASNRYFAELYGITTTNVSLLIKNLVENGYLESEIIYKEGTKEILNRYLKIVKGGYLKKFKGGIKKNLKDNNININNTSINKKINKKELEIEFEEVWKHYPRKIGKDKSLNYYIKARNEGTTKEQILKAVISYAEEVKTTPTKYIKHGSTWFNGKYWNDEIKETEEERLKRLEKELEEEENEFKTN